MNEKEYVLITGASSGIGSHLAMHFAESSYSLILLARRKELLHEVKEKCLKINSKISVETFICDVTKDEDLQKVQNFVNENNLTLKIVIANAGIPVQGYVSKLTVEDYKYQFETNVFGVLRTFYFFKDHLIQSKGHLALLGSVASYISSPKLTPYCMSKFAVKALSEGLFFEMKKFGVKCTLICPGLVESQIRLVNNKGQYKADAKDPAPDWIIMDTKSATLQMKKAILKGKKEVIITGHGKFIVFMQRHFPWFTHFLNSRNIMSG